MYIAGTFAILSLAPASDLDPKSGVFHAITLGSVALKVGALGIIAAILVTVGNAGGVGSTVAGVSRIPFVVGIDRYLPAAFGKIHSKWKTPYISILVQAAISGAILLLSQIKSDTVQSAYQLLIDAAIILYFIPFLYMFAGVIRLAGRGRRSEEKNAVLIPGGMTGVWICGAVGFLVVLVGIAVSAIPPGDEKHVYLFEAKLIIGTLVSVLIGLVLYWRGVRSKSKDAV
jgi:glutamate:GABA antiporter